MSVSRCLACAVTPLLPISLLLLAGVPSTLRSAIAPSSASFTRRPSLLCAYERLSCSLALSFVGAGCRCTSRLAAPHPLPDSDRVRHCNGARSFPTLPHKRRVGTCH